MNETPQTPRPHFEKGRWCRELQGFILNYMAQGVIFISCEKKITVFNPAAERMLGRTFSDVIDKHYEDVFEDETFGFSVECALEGKKIPPLINIPYFINHGLKREEMLEIEPTQVTVSNEEIESLCLIIIIRNITEIRHLETIADRKNRLQDLGEMASIIGHEIRNPLGGIKGFASLLVRDLEDQPQLQSMAQNVVQGIDDLNDILTELLNYSHPKTLQLETVDAAKVIRDVIRQMEADESIHKKADIIYEGPESFEGVQMDVPHIKSVLINLIFNAAEAFKEHGTIRINLKESGRYFQMIVADDGPGIPIELQTKIFHPFFSTKPHGSGFGLAESRRIIDSHGGEIEVWSEPGKGTVFTIILPREHED